ncbi:MAG: 1-deoxy-D-xylulose 5-phosphate reductoisomerase, partial [Elusimicrobia bacterium RIFOXYD2_FULL_34_30]
MKISVLGSTGSIGKSALNVISNFKNCTVIGLSANKN